MKTSALVLLLVTSIQQPGNEWQRLFYTPAERAALDREHDLTHAPLRHRYDGEARQRGGRLLRWVDGQATTLTPPPGIKQGEHWNPDRGSPQNKKGRQNE